MYKNFRAIVSFYKNNPEYIKFWARSLFHMSKPFYSLIFQVTNICNSRCITCFNWKILNKDTDKELTLEEVEKFTKKMNKLDTVTIGGGEPFLRKDLPKIVDCFNRNNNLKTIAIPTNCLSVDRILYSTEQILRQFNGRVKIGLSIDGIGQDHDKIRGVEGNFEKVLQTYNGLAKLKKRYSKLGLRLCATVFNMNIDKMIGLIECIQKNMPEIDFYGGIEFLRGDYNKNNVKEIRPEEFLPILDKIEKNAVNQNNFYRKTVSPIYYHLVLDILKRKKQIIPCRISPFYPVIDAYGNVYPCESREDKMGNLKDFNYDLNKIWQTEKARKLRKSIRNKECNCTHSAYQIPNIYLSSKMIWKIFRGKY